MNRTMNLAVARKAYWIMCLWALMFSYGGMETAAWLCFGGMLYLSGWQDGCRRGMRLGAEVMAKVIDVLRRSGGAP